MDDSARNEGPAPAPAWEEAEAEVDGLTNGLIGLPIHLWGWRVDADGFHRRGGLLRRGRDVPWRDVTAVYADGILLIVEGRRPGRRPGGLLDACGSAAARDAVMRAWDEYAEERIEREGRLAGEWSMPLVHRHLMLASWGVLLLGLSLFVALSPPRPREYAGFDQGRVRIWMHRPTRRRMVTFWSSVACFGVGGLCVSAVAAFRIRRARSSGRRWSKWELSRDGLAFWPDGERRVLLPGPGDVLMPSEGVISGERVPLRQMAYPQASRLLFALGERRGAAMRRDRSYWLAPGLLLGGALTAGFFLLEGPSEWQDGIAPLVVALSLVAIEVVRLSRRPGKALFHGRAMLDRLGW